MKNNHLNWALRFFFTILSIEALCLVSLHGQNFIRYSNQEIEKTETYIKGNPYQKDFLLFIDILQKSHPSFASEADFPFNIGALTRTGYQWADSCQSTKELWCHMQQIATLLNDGHTTLMPEINTDMIYPVILFLDDQGLYIRGINEEYRYCLGKQISQFNEHSLENIFDYFRRITSSDNDIYFKNKLVNFIQMYSMWDYTPYCSPDSILHIAFTDGTNVSVSPISRDKIKIAMQESSVEYKSIRQNSKTPFHYTVVKEKKICYFQFNSCIDQSSVRSQYLARYPDMPAEKLEELSSQYPRFDLFLDEMFETIRKDSIATLVIDVRNNAGGDSNLCDILLSRLKSSKNTEYMHSYTRFSELWKQQYPVLATEYEKVFAKLQRPFEMGELYDNYANPSSQPEQKAERYFLKNKNENLIFKGNVIFIQNAKTYSSAGILVTVAQDNGIGITIGEKSSYKPCTYGDLLAWQLPNTKLKGYVSHKIFIRPNAEKCSESYLTPTVYLCPNWENVLEGKDIYWEWVLREHGTDRE